MIDSDKQSVDQKEIKAIDWMNDPESLTDEEFDLLSKDKDFERVCKEIQYCKQALRKQQKSSLPDADLAWKQFQSQHGLSSKHHRAYWWGMVSGVAACLLLGILYWGIKPYLISDNEVLVFAANEYPREVILQSDREGKVTLDSGTKNEVLSQLGVTLDQTADTFSLVYNIGENSAVERHTLSTPRGKDFKLVLSDGTIVWLNAESQLEYPSRFIGNNRVVRLHGEAYFQVAPDKQKPFIVETDQVRTQVLGTEFNLCSYSATDTHITLISGSIEVSSYKQKTSPIRVSPGKDAHLQPDGSFVLKQVDIDTYIYWKEGFFYFDNTALADIMQEIGRWYNVNIVFRQKEAMTYKMHYFCDRKKDISHAIELLNMMGKVQARLENNTIYIE